MYGSISDVNIRNLYHNESGIMVKNLQKYNL